ncbi:MAG: hypothetical protein L0387_24235 [Acidobacteria bacterium]|nr:hypothetical protein [Acidobacteriota bacterium]MCI0717916.1 hypothetical protein [Acidobacteriota bacterium]
MKSFSKYGCACLLLLLLSVSVACNSVESPSKTSEVKPKEAASAPATTNTQPAAIDEPKQTATSTMPKTASPLPVVGFIGIASAGLALTLRVIRKWNTKQRD